MYSLWHTGHSICTTVMRHFKQGMAYISESGDYPLRHVDQYSGESNNISYGFLRGTDRIFQNSNEYWEIDRGYFKPGHFDGYYRISMNGTRARYNAKVAERLSSKRFKALGIHPEEWQPANKPGFVLIVPPTHAVTSFHKAPKQWADEIADILDDKTDYPVRVRHKSGQVCPLRDDLANARCVITYNSNVSIDALLAGVPVVAEDGLINGWNLLTLDDIIRGADLRKDPVTGQMLDRQKLFNFAAHQQYTLDEMRTGKPWLAVQAMQKYGELP